MKGGDLMITSVVTFLGTLGITVTVNDPLLIFVVNAVENQIKNTINQTTIPDELSSVAVKMAAGQYLQLMKNSGQLQSENLDLSVVEKQITEGDTSVTFAIGEGCKTPEQRLDSLITYLMTDGQEQFKRFRRLVW